MACKKIGQRRAPRRRTARKAPRTDRRSLAVTSLPMLDPLLADLRICLRDLARSRRRTASAASAAAFGVAALMLAAGFIDWIFLAMRDATIHSQLGHIKGRASRVTTARARPIPSRSCCPATTRPSFARSSRCRTTGSSRRGSSFNALLSRGDTTVSVIGEGVMPEKERELGRSIAIVAGPRRWRTTKRSRSWSARAWPALAGLAVGDTVVLLATTASGGTNMVEATVAGISTSADQGGRRLGGARAASARAATAARVRREHLDAYCSIAPTPPRRPSSRCAAASRPSASKSSPGPSSPTSTTRPSRSFRDRSRSCAGSSPSSSCSASRTA